MDAGQQREQQVVFQSSSEGRVMSDRPFLLFHSRDEEGRHVLKVQGDGIPLTERVLTLDDCLRHIKHFTATAMEIMDEERRKKQSETSSSST